MKLLEAAGIQARLLLHDPPGSYIDRLGFLNKAPGSIHSPVLGGVYKSMYCMELPLVFDNIARCEEMMGGGKDAYILADKMSQAWIAFARTGNPKHKGLRVWPPYVPQNGATMLFDNVNQVKNHYDKELLQLVADKAL